MATYIYYCEACNAHFEEDRSFAQGPRKKCWECGAKAPLFYQDYSLYKQVAFVYNVNLCGNVAEKNAKRLGKEQLQLKEEKQKEKRPFTGKLPDGAKRPKVYKGKPK